MELNIVGPRILIRIPTGIPFLGDIEITETVIISWLVLGIITGLCLFLTRDLQVERISKKQAVAEMIYETGYHFILNNMGKKYLSYLPFIGAIFVTSLISSLMSLVGLRSPTADLSTEAAWAVVVFVLITIQKIKSGGWNGYLKGFTKPIPLLTPFNIISELVTPVSLACRHFGNILSGLVISALLYAALEALSGTVFGTIPGILGDILSQIPLLTLGIPAVLSLYFDWFSSFMQAFIFCMLTAIFIANAADEGDERGA